MIIYMCVFIRKIKGNHVHRFAKDHDKFLLIQDINFALRLLQFHSTLIHCSLLVAEVVVAGRTAVVAGHIAEVAAVGAADHTVAAAVHIDHTATIPLVAAVVAAAVVVGSSQVGSSFVLGCNYCLHLLFHLQSFP